MKFKTFFKSVFAMVVTWFLIVVTLAIIGIIFLIKHL